jgi:siderophore synthetase component
MKTIKALKSKWTQPVLKKAFKENNSRYPKDLKEDIKKVSKNEVPNAEIAEALKIDASYISKWLAKPASKKKATKKKVVKKKTLKNDQGDFVRKFGQWWPKSDLVWSQALMKNQSDLLSHLAHFRKIDKELDQLKIFEENFNAGAEAVLQDNFIVVLKSIHYRLEDLCISGYDEENFKMESLYINKALRHIIQMLESLTDFMADPEDFKRLKELKSRLE